QWGADQWGADQWGADQWGADQWGQVSLIRGVTINEFRQPCDDCLMPELRRLVPAYFWRCDAW
ncbi:MAG TPA: hypothetical protein PLY87_02610, partial [Planctomycetaceae bacterium]|nr:hypothetical protein [Planctomycetaceae bacterium]